MPVKKSKPSKPKTRVPKKARPEAAAAESQRPPDSAEDFEHVLRRLVARRGQSSADPAAV